jgi:tetratricopeptide (TPR) repeat protein
VHGASARALLAIGVVVGGLFIWQALDRILSLESPVSAWTDAIEKLPRDARSVGRWFPYLNRGSAYVDGNQFSLAMRDFESSAALGDMGMGALSLGSLLSASGRHPQALAAFDRAEKEGYDVYNLPFQRGLALLATGKPADAYRQFQLAWAKNPPSPTRELTLLHLGRTGLQLGRHDEALGYLDQLVTLAPEHKEGRFALGMALVSRGQNERARQILDQLVAEGGKAPAYYGRALANYGLKRKAEALSDIETAIRIGPDHPNLREWQARIKAMP